MSSPTTPTPAPTDPYPAVPLAWAERRRALLEELADIGMALAREIAARTVQASLHPEPRHDPNRSYAAVSRAVRLTLRLEARVEADIIALRKGEAPKLWNDGGRAASLAATAAAGRVAPSCDGASVRAEARAETRERESSDWEPGDLDAAPRGSSVAGEAFAGDEDDDGDLLVRPIRKCFEAVRAELEAALMEPEGDRAEAPRLPTPLGFAESAVPRSGREEELTRPSPQVAPSGGAESSSSISPASAASKVLAGRPVESLAATTTMAGRMFLPNSS